MSTAEQFSRFFEVKLDLFDGPIDLLLHLVKKRELPIEKVSLAEVTGQYLECIKSLQYYDVELAAEYLVIAATLLSVKASVLLNDPVELVVDESGSLVDPHEELLRRLRELETYRAAAGELASRPTLGSEVFAAPSKGTKIDPALIPLADHQSELLVQAFQQVLTRLGEKARVFSITIDSVSVVERMRMVVDTIRARGGVSSFRDLFAGRYDRASAIGVFVAILELCKRRMIAVEQDGPKAEIAIRLAEVPAQSESLPESDQELSVVAA
ncbi:MAG: segregation and condensation protein A [Pseudomonadota bacterium]|jgi:segregation and condensation protein A